MFAKLTSRTPTADATAVKLIGFIKGIDVDGQAPGLDRDNAQLAVMRLATEITDQLRFTGKVMDPQQKQFLTEALPGLRELSTMRSGAAQPMVGAETSPRWEPDPFWMEKAAEFKGGFTKRAEALMEARFLPSVEADRAAGVMPQTPENKTARTVAHMMGR
ncbi:MAG: hypothetical protein KI792_03310 [Alphaproteobacteria bacterium]|nr:hypothetical protein [Alphaproteobacteria bacterium SS10]